MDNQAAAPGAHLITVTAYHQAEAPDPPGRGFTDTATTTPGRRRPASLARRIRPQFYAGGGSAGAEFMALTLTQVRDAMLAGGCPEENFDHCLALLQNPGRMVPNFAIIGASGR